MFKSSINVITSLQKANKTSYCFDTIENMYYNPMQSLLSALGPSKIFYIICVVIKSNVPVIIYIISIQ